MLHYSGSARCSRSPGRAPQRRTSWCGESFLRSAQTSRSLLETSPIGQPTVRDRCTVTANRQTNKEKGQARFVERGKRRFCVSDPPAAPARSWPPRQSTNCVHSEASQRGVRSALDPALSLSGQPGDDLKACILRCAPLRTIWRPGEVFSLLARRSRSGPCPCQASSSAMRWTAQCWPPSVSPSLRLPIPFARSGPSSAERPSSVPPWLTVQRAE